jgi:hypothetical protein
LRRPKLGRARGSHLLLVTTFRNFFLVSVEDLGRRHDVRPGHGRSSFQPGRRLTDWPGDVQYLAEHLDLKRYAVLGSTCGVPHALACEYVIASRTLGSVCLLCSAAPWEVGTRDVPWSARVGSWAATYCPCLATWVLNLVLGTAQRVAASIAGRRLLDALATKAMSSAGREIPQSEKRPEVAKASRERLLPVLRSHSPRARRALSKTRTCSHIRTDSDTKMFALRGCRSGTGPELAVPNSAVHDGAATSLRLARTRRRNPLHCNEASGADSAKAD